MKKLFIAIAAIAAFTACSKQDVIFNEPSQISISAVSQNRTKAMVEGLEFPAENFAVWAYYKQLSAGTSIVDWQSATNVSQNIYINEKPFKPSGTEGLWSGVPPYYWPKIGSLLFAGYYPVSIDNPTDEKPEGIVKYEFTSEVNKMTVADYSPGNYETTGFVNTASNADHVEDFMYFNMTAASCDGNTVGKDNSVDSGSQVDVYFRHALSWISVVLSEADNTPEGAEITVNSITFTEVKTKGTGVVDNSAEDNEIDWNTVSSPSTDIVVLNQDKVLGDATTVEKQPIVIPQTMAGNLIVVYTISSKDGSSFQETKTIELATLDTNNTSWKPGKKYTYNITIGTTEILIDPIIIEWAPVVTTIPVQ